LRQISSSSVDEAQRVQRDKANLIAVLSQRLNFHAPTAKKMLYEMLFHNQIRRRSSSRDSSCSVSERTTFPIRVENALSAVVEIDELLIKPSDTIGDLKRRIVQVRRPNAPSLRSEMRHLRLWHIFQQERHQLLEDAMTVEACGIGPESVIAIVSDSYRTRHSFQAHKMAVRAMCCTPDQRFFITCANDGHAIVWSAVNYTRVFTFSHSQAVTSVCTVGNDSIVTGSMDKTAKIWSLADGKLSHDLGLHSNAVSSVAASPQLRQVFTACKDKRVTVWCALRGTKLREFDVWRSVQEMRVTPDGKHLVTGTHRGLGIWKLDDGRMISARGTSWLHRRSIFTVDLSADGRYIAVGGMSKVFAWRLDIPQNAEEELAAESPLPSPHPGWNHAMSAVTEIGVPEFGTFARISAHGDYLLAHNVVCAQNDEEQRWEPFREIEHESSEVMVITATVVLADDGSFAYATQQGKVFIEPFDLGRTTSQAHVESADTTVD